MPGKAISPFRPLDQIHEVPTPDDVKDRKTNRRVSPVRPASPAPTIEYATPASSSSGQTIAYPSPGGVLLPTTENAANLPEEQCADDPDSDEDDQDIKT